MYILIDVLKDHSVIAGDGDGPVIPDLSPQLVKPVLPDDPQLFQAWQVIKQIQGEPDLWNICLR